MDAKPTSMAEPKLEPSEGLEGFHPAIQRWFESRFPEGPSLPQLHGWPRIAEESDTLIAAPTGSGKTLAAFLVCIDRFYAAAMEDP